jgi:hypothetical protein
VKTCPKKGRSATKKSFRRQISERLEPLIARRSVTGSRLLREPEPASMSAQQVVDLRSRMAVDVLQAPVEDVNVNEILALASKDGGQPGGPTRRGFGGGAPAAAALTSPPGGAVHSPTPPMSAPPARRPGARPGSAGATRPGSVSARSALGTTSRTRLPRTQLVDATDVGGSGSGPPALLHRASAVAPALVVNKPGPRPHAASARGHYDPHAREPDLFDLRDLPIVPMRRTYRA